MQKITPFLWFDGKLEEAMTFYTGIFENSRMSDIVRYGDAGPGPKGAVMTATFELAGQQFYGLNGGPMFAFSPAISFFIKCETQDEVDHFWDALSQGGEKGQCGWLKDPFGVSWQVVPTVLQRLLHDSNAERSNRVMRAMLKMHKLEIEPLERAYAGA